MGMYTELYLTVGFKENTPNNVINILKYMCDPKEYVEPDFLPHDEEFFTKTHWAKFFRNSSHNFAPASTVNLWYNDIAKGWFLTLRCDLKNYDNQIGSFLKWIMPYVYVYGGSHSHIGHIRYEEDREPTLLYIEKQCQYIKFEQA